ncbi:Protein kinase, catalytic domain-containing protein [Cynara cardunculus var. scolymus]|uniref:Protein kinase, catalytic domain-containing protein n=1 Tax=Cynara cardunculus var. scolymus TaxID=59895 RepID=A0A124SHE5_CYNCS|nr:Protein kinase, catalytic domain-containing protein [Cynara cardunculus var. scolymus]
MFHRSISRLNWWLDLYPTMPPRMKRDKNHFVQKLSCGISTMKRNDDIIKIRGPKLVRNPKTPLSYDQMLPSDHKKPTQNDEDLFSIEFDSSCKYFRNNVHSEYNNTSSTSTRTSISDGYLTLGNNQEEKIKQLSTLLEALGEEQENSWGETTEEQVQMPPIPEEKVQLDQKKCTTCSSTRPTSEWQSREFSYSELVDATNRFSSNNLIYRGENEAVFHGTLKGTKLNVIVKEQKDVKKYKSEMQALEKTRNENVVMLLGTCLENNPRLLVFELACNGSLDQHLSRKISLRYIRPSLLINQHQRPLIWTERIKIAIGASRGLLHLHENNIIHGDIAGFGLARMKNEPDNSSDHFIIGTFGYLAPEYTERGNATTETDVYAFGIVLLELLTGRSPTDTRLKGQSFIEWVIFTSYKKKKNFYYFFT